MTQAKISDLEKLQSVEKKLLSALDSAQQVASLLSNGGSQQDLERLCTAFVSDAQESQLALLQLADRHQQPLLLQNNDYRQRLALAAAQKQVEAAEAQLAGAASDSGAPRVGGGPAAGAGSVQSH